MPLLDVNQNPKLIAQKGELFQVDSLYALNVPSDPGVVALLDEPGWRWNGGGPWGPLVTDDEENFREGLLRAEKLVPRSRRIAKPLWDLGDPLHLLLAAVLGDATYLRRVDVGVAYRSLLSEMVNDHDLLSPALATLQHLEVDRSTEAVRNDGIVVVRAEVPQDVVDFWNMRAYGCEVRALPADTDLNFVGELLAESLPAQIDDSTGGILLVHGLERASPEVSLALQHAAQRVGAEILSDKTIPPIEHLRGDVRTRFGRSFRSTFEGTAPGITIDAIPLPLVGEAGVDVVRHGLVAYEVSFDEVLGQDPRYTAYPPGVRSESASLKSSRFAMEHRQIRATYDGIALTQEAGHDDVSVPFLMVADAIRLLFGTDGVSVQPSDVGKFQLRAAEKLGGLGTDLFNQPGVRAALLDAGEHPVGVTLPRLRQRVLDSREGRTQ